MKQLIYLSFLFFSLISSDSCAQAGEEVKTVVDEFVQAMYKPVNFKTMKSLYVDFPFMSINRADVHEVKNMSKDGDAVNVEVYSYWSKSNGHKIENDFILKVKKINGDWKIINSKNLSDIKGFYPKAYDFAIANGMLEKEEDIWDIELLNILKEAKKKKGN